MNARKRDLKSSFTQRSLDHTQLTKHHWETAVIWKTRRTLINITDDVRQIVNGLRPSWLNDRVLSGAANQ